MTQEDLAEVAQCDVKTLRRAEQGKRIDIASLRRIACALGMNAPALCATGDAMSAASRIVEDWSQAMMATDKKGLLQTYVPDVYVTVGLQDELSYSGETVHGTTNMVPHLDHVFAEIETPRAQYELLPSANRVFMTGSAIVRLRECGTWVGGGFMQDYLLYRGKIKRLTSYSNYRVLNSENSILPTGWIDALWNIGD